MLGGWCGRWAPWARPRAGTVLRLILNKLVGRKYDLKADEVATLLQVTYDERQMLSLRTIGACDIPQHVRRSMAKSRKRDIDRQRQAEIRRQNGRQPRESFLAANSISRVKPWLACNISRATWYRRDKTGLSQLENIIVGDTPVSTVTLGARQTDIVTAAKASFSSKAPNGAASANDDTEQRKVQKELSVMGGASV